jgi:photosystem II stability/assembly factor-like uncharacterized protein
MTDPLLGLRALTVGAASGLLILASTISPADASSTTWQVPHCGAVSGAVGGVSFTRSDGHQITPTDDTLGAVTYSHVGAFGTPNALVALSKNTIWRSDDAGCTWTAIASPKQLAQYDVVASDDVAYAYGVHEQEVYRIQGSTVTSMMGPVSQDGLVTMHVDAADPDSLRAVSSSGAVFDSADGGHTWMPIGVPPTTDGYVYDASIDSGDADHIVVGAGWEGYVTFDGGQTWTPMSGNGPAHTNVFSVAISPADSSTVWIEGYDLTLSGNGARNIWRSDDGGLTYRQIIDGTEVTLYNGTSLWPSPADTDVLYFEFGTWFGGYGTYLYRLDDARQTVTSTHSGYDGIDSLVFSPADPTVMYLGLSEER